MFSHSCGFLCHRRTLFCRRRTLFCRRRTSFSRRRTLSCRRRTLVYGRRKLFGHRHRLFSGCEGSFWGGAALFCFGDALSCRRRSEERNSAEGVRKFQPWVGRVKSPTVREGYCGLNGVQVEVALPDGRASDTTRHSEFATLSEFLNRKTTVYPGRCPGLQFANAFGVGLRWNL